VISTLLRAEAMTAGYGKMAILHDVTFIVTPGELVAVIGPNGAGKSTAFKVIVGFLKPSEGRVLFDGDDITGLRPDQVLRRGLAYVPQGRIVFPQMTVLENLEMGAYIEPDPRKIRAALDRVYALFPILRERRSQKAGTMSGGEQQMLAMARVLRTGAHLLLLDEITEGLAPVIVQSLAQVIRNLKERGFTIVLVEQNFRFAAPLADRHYVVEHGRIAEAFAAAELDAKTAMLHEYLGV
jgi:branched-chain amino acid transport system ATP-binding protein